MSNSVMFPHLFMFLASSMLELIKNVGKENSENTGIIVINIIIPIFSKSIKMFFVFFPGLQTYLASGVGSRG